MIKKIIEAVEKHLPLTVLRSEWGDPVLSLIGAGWRFNTTSAWRIVNDSKMIVGSEDHSADEVINNLGGVNIIGCESMSSSPDLDPRFIFDNGCKLEVFSASATEPWVLSFEEGYTFVASPTA